EVVRKTGLQHRRHSRHARRPVGLAGEHGGDLLREFGVAFGLAGAEDPVVEGFGHGVPIGEVRRLVSPRGRPYVALHHSWSLPVKTYTVELRHAASKRT